MGSLREEEARSLLARLEAAPVRSDFPYEEPEDYESIPIDPAPDCPIRSGRWMPTFYRPHRRRLVWPNGRLCLGYSR